MTLLLNALSGVTNASIESADVDWTWLWVRVLISRRMHAFDLQNFLDKAAKRKAIP